MFYKAENETVACLRRFFIDVQDSPSWRSVIGRRNEYGKCSPNSSTVSMTYYSLLIILVYLPHYWFFVSFHFFMSVSHTRKIQIYDLELAHK